MDLKNISKNNSLIKEIYLKGSSAKAKLPFYFKCNKIYRLSIKLFTCVGMKLSTPIYNF